MQYIVIDSADNVIYNDKAGNQIDAIKKSFSTGRVRRGVTLYVYEIANEYKFTKVYKKNFKFNKNNTDVKLS